ncbi:MAG: hypothetical protein RR014_03320, partial [Bilophila sp.]
GKLNVTPPARDMAYKTAFESHTAGQRGYGHGCKQRVKSILLLKHAVFQRIILGKNVVFPKIHAALRRLSRLRQQSIFKIKML